MKMYRAMGLQNTPAGADSKSGFFVLSNAVSSRLAGVARPAAAGAARNQAPLPGCTW
jgi:hypothetical protein